MTSVSLSTQQYTGIIYDGAGNIVKSIDFSAKLEYNYEYEEGKIIRATEADIELSGEIVTAKVMINTIKYYYDTDGRMTKKVISPATGSAQTVYYENPENESTVVKFTAGGRTVTSHSKTDSFGRKIFDELQLGTDFVSRQFVYHAGKVTDQHKTNAKVKSSATTQPVSRIALSDGRTISYEYDAEERITKVTDSIDGITEYTYDALGQLLSEKKNGTAVNTMVYDNYGNLLNKNGKVYTYGDSTWKDLLTSYDGQSITYDAQGNPTNYLGHTLTWEKGRQLKKFDSNTYTYNANGIRTSKTVNGVKHTYTLDGTKILREEWDENTLVPLYDNEDSVCGILYNDVPYYFQKNLQGDIIGIVDKDANVVAKYSYDAWGVCTITQDNSAIGIATINPFRYRGYYFDNEIGMYYLQSRYFNPVVGRFVNCDALDCLINGETAHRFNGFSYCENDPINNDDPSGMWIQYVIGAALGGIINVVFYVIDCCIAKTKINVWKALLNFLNRAVNGLIAATGAATIWQIIAGISGGLISLFIGASKPTLEDLIIAVICGILSGILAGTLSKGTNKHINYLMKNFGKKVKANIFKSDFGKNLLKAAKYVFKNSKTLLWIFIKSYCIPNVLIAAIPRIKAVLGV